MNTISSLGTTRSTRRRMRCEKARRKFRQSGRASLRKAACRYMPRQRLGISSRYVRVASLHCDDSSAADRSLAGQATWTNSLTLHEWLDSRLNVCSAKVYFEKLDQRYH